MSSPFIGSALLDTERVVRNDIRASLSVIVDRLMQPLVIPSPG
jgi:hypothetical protein